mgnify:FL=1
MVDGTTVVDVTADAPDAAIAGFGICQGTGHVCDQGSGDLYFDDMAINDNTGSTQNSWPGPGKIVHLQPDSAGDTDNSTTTPTGWQQVDEITPDDITTTAWLDADNDILDVNLESHSSAGIDPNSSITFVSPGIRSVVDGVAGATWQLGLKSQSSGTIVNGTAQVHNDRTWKTNGDINPSFPGNYTLHSFTDPQAGGPWTPLLLDSMQIRASTTEATPDVGISTLWALVEYVIPQARIGLKNARIKFSGGRILLRSTNQ